MVIVCFFYFFFPSIEFISFHSTSKVTVQCYSQGINQQKRVGLSHYSDWLSRYPHQKLEKLKMCETCCVNGRHVKYVKYRNIPTQFGFLLSLECSEEVLRKSVQSAYPINSRKVDVFLQKSYAGFLLIKVPT